MQQQQQSPYSLRCVYHKCKRNISAVLCLNLNISANNTESKTIEETRERERETITCTVCLERTRIIKYSALFLVLLY